jgi:hypothetical protein
MPNHVTTILKVVASEEENWERDEKDLKNLIAKVKSPKTTPKDEQREFDFNQIIPKPAGLYEGPIGEKERAKYGVKTWLDWCPQNWGTKWNAYAVKFDGYDTYTFDTAWNHPDPVIKALSEQYPTLEFKVMYADEDIGSNLAAYRMLNGEIIEIANFHKGLTAEMFATAVKAASNY